MCLGESVGLCDFLEGKTVQELAVIHQFSFDVLGGNNFQVMLARVKCAVVIGSLTLTFRVRRKDKDKRNS